MCFVGLGMSVDFMSVQSSCDVMRGVTFAVLPQSMTLSQP